MIRKEDLAASSYYTGSEKQDRYPITEKQCPICGNPLLEDNFPPNYWQFSGGNHGGTFSGSQKYICLSCITEHEISYQGKWDDNGKEIERTEKIESTTPLVLMGELYLTPFEEWNESYKQEHGVYPNVAYA